MKSIHDRFRSRRGACGAEEVHRWRRRRRGGGGEGREGRRFGLSVDCDHPGFSKTANNYDNDGDRTAFGGAGGRMIPADFVSLELSALPPTTQLITGRESRVESWDMQRRRRRKQRSRAPCATCTPTPPSHTQTPPCASSDNSPCAPAAL